MCPVSITHGSLFRVCREEMERHRLQLASKLKASGYVTAADAVAALRRDKEHTKRFFALQLCINREKAKLKVCI